MSSRVASHPRSCSPTSYPARHLTSHRHLTRWSLSPSHLTITHWPSLPLAGVPIFCVIMRYNLVSGGLCSERWAHVWSSALPWGTAWALYQGSVTLRLLSWSGLILNGFIDFLMPGLVTLVSLGAARRLLLWRHPHSKTTPPLGNSDAAYVARSPPPSSPPLLSPIQPFPAWLRPRYVEIVAGMMGFLLLVLPLAIWLQIYCSGSTACYGAATHR